MGYFDLFRFEVLTYPKDYCHIEILEYAIINGGNVLNVGEKFKFRAKVTNQGPLDMVNVRLQAQATDFADVSLDGGSFGSTALSSIFSLPVGQSHTTGFYNGRAKRITHMGEAIAAVRISQWQPDMHRLETLMGASSLPVGQIKQVIFNN